MDTFTVYDFKQTLHINYGAKGGESQSRGIINCPDHALHGKILWRITMTPKNKWGQWGTGKTKFYIGNDKKGFKDLQSLREHYDLPPYSPPSENKKQ